MSEETVKASEPDLGFRVLIENDGYYVLVSHKELDDLIGRTMQMFELNGDIEQRNALKQEFKWRARAWLDNLYADSGYRDFQLSPKAKLVDVTKK